MEKKQDLVKMSLLNPVLSIHERSTELHLFLLQIFPKVLLMAELKYDPKKGTEVISKKISNIN